MLCTTFLFLYGYGVKKDHINLDYICFLFLNAGVRKKEQKINKL